MDRLQTDDFIIMSFGRKVCDHADAVQESTP